MHKRQWFILIAFILFLGVDLVILVWWHNRPTTQEPPPAISVSSDQLPHTIIVPTLDTPIPESKNVIWCASFQMAWNKLKNDVVKEPVKIKGAEELAERLNKSPVTDVDLPEGSYYAAAGFSRDGIEKTIKKEMGKRFPHWAVGEFSGGADGVAVAYAYLESRLQFEKLFDVLDEPISFTASDGSTKKVPGFGISWKAVREHRHDKLWNQASVPAAISSSEFAVELHGKEAHLQLLLVRIDRKGTLEQCLADAQRLLLSRQRKPTSETLFIPTMDWGVSHTYRNLEGPDKLFLNPALAGAFVQTAQQDIRFRLDRSGALLQSEAIIEAKKDAGPSENPIELAFNRPFLIILKKRDAANPFFVMWVDNAELLQKWGE
jgi:hypothetical protein